MSQHLLLDKAALGNLAVHEVFLVFRGPFDRVRVRIVGGLPVAGLFSAQPLPVSVFGLFGVGRERGALRGRHCLGLANGCRLVLRWLGVGRNHQNDRKSSGNQNEPRTEPASHGHGMILYREWMEPGAEES